MNKKDKRMNRLITILQEQKNISVKKMAELLDVSEMTIRRDLNVLKNNHVVERSYGHATYSGSSISADMESDYDLSMEQIKQNAEKDKIGRFAAGLIEPGDILIIDTGSTTDKLAKYIADDLNITVLCYNFNIFAELRKRRGVNLIFAGGYFHPSDQMVESPEGISLIKGIRANKLFISASGIHEKLGVTCAHNYEVLTKRAVLESALTKILIADSTKFGIVRTAYFAQLSELDVIVTDSGLSPEWRAAIEAAGIRLHLVD